MYFLECYVLKLKMKKIYCIYDDKSLNRNRKKNCQPQKNKKMKKNKILRYYKIFSYKKLI